MPQQTQPLYPFLKWAGGKRWFAQAYAKFFPKTYRHYYEPFLGSGAIFFYLRPRLSTLSDNNEDLVNAYLALRSSPVSIARILRRHQSRHSKTYYYHIRSLKSTDPLYSAARFVYLNRTCWNGLYRVNKYGLFNVPLGTKTNVLLPTDDFISTSRVLHDATLLCCDFERTIDLAERGDFIFADPPYTVKHNNNGFIKYNDNLFSWDDQIRLRNALWRASVRGVKILLTNANHFTVRELYSDFAVLQTVRRSSLLSADIRYRSAVEELVVRSWI